MHSNSAWHKLEFPSPIIQLKCVNTVCCTSDGENCLQCLTYLKKKNTIWTTHVRACACMCVCVCARACYNVPVLDKTWFGENSCHVNYEACILHLGSPRRHKHRQTTLESQTFREVWDTTVRPTIWTRGSQLFPTSTLPYRLAGRKIRNEVSVWNTTAVVKTATKLGLPCKQVHVLLIFLVISKVLGTGSACFQCCCCNSYASIQVFITKTRSSSWRFHYLAQLFTATSRLATKYYLHKTYFLILISLTPVPEAVRSIRRRQVLAAWLLGS